MLRVVWAKWWVLPSWPASCWCRAIGPWWGSRDRRRAIPCHGRPVSAGGSWTVGAGRLQRSYHPLRRWPDLLVLGPWSSFHSSSTFFFFFKKKGKPFNNYFSLFFVVVVVTLKVCCCYFFQKGGEQEMNDHQSQSNQQFSLTFGVLTTGLRLWKPWYQWMVKRRSIRNFINLFGCYFLFFLTIISIWKGMFSFFQVVRPTGVQQNEWAMFLPLAHEVYYTYNFFVFLWPRDVYVLDVCTL